ncbi:Uu.00g142250.m01.CDS01 [Anthostomella pinea]|uniref:Uu.00g142250.m01.CDS01 n=1 Tax=Anthostomella pinea TaxID=933095 RepID=A0AAI8YLK7_9PEZI|nr:Uu.00g142250.m01.CDS01 [Anthostomella pinea]
MKTSVASALVSAFLTTGAIAKIPSAINDDGPYGIPAASSLSAPPIMPEHSHHPGGGPGGPGPHGGEDGHGHPEHGGQWGHGPWASSSLPPSAVPSAAPTGPPGPHHFPLSILPRRHGGPATFITVTSSSAAASASAAPSHHPNPRQPCQNDDDCRCATDMVRREPKCVKNEQGVK